MNLPLILDVAIGLIFIYLILSLLASEIQEILATILQWRAAHLKKSIEILLTGGEGTSEEDKIKKIVDDLYSNPLIQNINQEAKEGIAAWFRQMVWQLGKVYRSLRQKNLTPFGQEVGRDGTVKDRRSAPSYIPSETFATTLLERMNINRLSQKLSGLNLLKFKDHEIKSEIKNILAKLEISEETRSALDKEFNKLQYNIDKIFIRFQTSKASLIDSISRIEDEIVKYIENSKDYFADNEASSKKQFINEITALKQNLFINTDELVRRLKPGLSEIVYVLQTGGRLYKGIKDEIEDKNSEIYKAYEDTENEIQQVVEKFPQSLRKSLAALASRAQMKSGQVEQELNQFRREIEVWFDQSMDRASGVYKRNAKGVAFLIGLFLAFAANADTFHMASRLSKDTALRNAIVNNAGQAASDPICLSSETLDQSTSQPTGQPPSKLDCIRSKVNQNLDQLSLPLGRSPDNLKQQEEESKVWFFPPLKRFLGWTLSGLAISMGAPFWFQLLSKIINVRNTGPKPPSSTEQQPPAR